MNAGSAPVTARCSPSFFSSVEKYGEKKNTAARGRPLIASANWSSCSRTVEDAALLGDLEQRPGVDLGDLFHYRSLSSRCAVPARAR